MRRRRVIVGVVAGVVAAAAVIIATGASGDTSTPAARRGVAATLATASTTAGAIEVEITPTSLDDTAAVFRIVLDTHSVELDVDLAKTARLSVAGVVWPVAGWSGDGPGGHHRQGELTFTAAGRPSGAVRLTIDGLPEPVDARWSLER